MASGAIYIKPIAMTVAIDHFKMEPSNIDLIKKEEEKEK